jgi:uncharacterized protein YciI
MPGKTGTASITGRRRRAGQHRAVKGFDRENDFDIARIHRGIYIPSCRSTGMEKKYFLAKLIPPRPSFTTDMTAKERQVMMDHGAYLRNYVEAGTVIVMGPVLDPAGSWGLAVFEASSEDVVRSITARDPTVLSGLGFRWEIYPMAQAVVRT